MTFEQLSAPGAFAGNGVHLVIYSGKSGDGFAAAPGVTFSNKHGWFGVERPARIEAPVPEVPEPASALLLACGLVAVYLWARRA